jgi:hypothetical protein
MISERDKRFQCTVARETYDWLQTEGEILKLRRREGRVIDRLVEEITRLRKKCGDFETDNDGHPVK